MTLARFIVLTGALVAVAFGGTVAAADPAVTDRYSPATPFCATNVGTGGTACADSPADLDSLKVGSGSVITPQVSVLIARLYDNANYDTANGYLEIYSAGDCTASKTNVDYQNADLGSWRNRVSSFQSFGNCATKLWSATNFGGSPYPSSGYLVNSSYVGASMNDNAESAQFS